MVVLIRGISSIGSREFRGSNKLYVALKAVKHSNNWVGQMFAVFTYVVLSVCARFGCFL